MKLKLNRRESNLWEQPIGTAEVSTTLVYDSYHITGIEIIRNETGKEWWKVEVRSSTSDRNPQIGYIPKKFLVEDIDNAIDPVNPIEIHRGDFFKTLSFAAAIYGSNLDYLASLAQMESGIKNVQGQNIGPFQFTSLIWAELINLFLEDELTPEDIFRPVCQAQIAAHLSGRNIEIFLEKTGGLPTGIELYLCDAFGVDVAQTILKAAENDNTQKISSVLNLPIGKQYLGANKASEIISNNDSTVADLLKGIEQQMQDAIDSIWDEIKSLPHDIDTTIDSGEPPWLRVAREELTKNIHEVPGDGPSHSNTRIEDYHASAGGREPDDVPWCASFVSFCMEYSDNSIIKNNNLKSKRAADWLNWGEHIDNPPVGAICVMNPLAPKSSGHVGFLLKRNSRTVTLLGGNQGNALCEKDFPANKIREFRWLNWSQVSNVSPPQNGAGSVNIFPNKVPTTWRNKANPHLLRDLVRAFTDQAKMSDHHDLTAPIVLAYACATICFESSWNPKAVNKTDRYSKSGYPGAGLAQITSKANYVMVSERTGIDFVNHPEKMFDPYDSLRAKAAFYQENGMIPRIISGDYESAAGKYNAGNFNYRSKYTKNVKNAVPEWSSVFS